jgi:hypothetical protein
MWASPKHMPCFLCSHRRSHLRRLERHHREHGGAREAHCSLQHPRHLLQAELDRGQLLGLQLLHRED